MTNTPIAAKLATLEQKWRDEAKKRIATGNVDMFAYGDALRDCAGQLHAALAEYDTAKGAEPPSSAWQPISTAPKDGSFLTINPHGAIEEVELTDNPWRNGKVHVFNKWSGRWFTAHWWMPKPPQPPTSAPEDK